MALLLPLLVFMLYSVSKVDTVRYDVSLVTCAVYCVIYRLTLGQTELYPIHSMASLRANLPTSVKPWRFT